MTINTSFDFTPNFVCLENDQKKAVHLDNVQMVDCGFDATVRNSKKFCRHMRKLVKKATNLQAAPLPPTPLWFQAVCRLICSPASRQAHFGAPGWFWGSFLVLLAPLEAPLGASGGGWGPIWAVLAAPRAHFWRSWAPGEPQEAKTVSPLGVPGSSQAMQPRASFRHFLIFFSPWPLIAWPRLPFRLSSPPIASHGLVLVTF